MRSGYRSEDVVSRVEAQTPTPGRGEIKRGRKEIARYKRAEEEVGEEEGEEEEEGDGEMRAPRTRGGKRSKGGQTKKKTRRRIGSGQQGEEEDTGVSGDVAMGLTMDKDRDQSEPKDQLQQQHRGPSGAYVSSRVMSREVGPDKSQRSWRRRMSWQALFSVFLPILNTRTQ